MAHAHVSRYATAATVKNNDGEIWIAVGDFSFRMEKEEAAKLAADLLDCISNDAGEIEGRKLMDAQDVAAEMAA